MLMVACLIIPFCGKKTNFAAFLCMKGSKNMANCLNFGKRYEDDNRYFSSPLPFRFVELYQVGELSCEAGYTVEKHEQTVFEITYVVAGKGTIVCDGRTFPVEENSVFLNAPRQTHELRADRDASFHFCYLGFRFLDGRMGNVELERFYRSWNGSAAFCDKGLLVTFLKLFHELHEKHEGWLTMVGAYTEQLVTDVYRTYTEVRGGRPLAASEGRGGAAYMTKRYIDRHYRDVEDLRELAATLGYSYTYLAHTFKEKIGVTIGSYIIGKTMEEAKWLLRAGRISISQIATRFNYHSVQSFSNSFKKAVGMSPTDFRALSAAEAEIHIRHL